MSELEVLVLDDDLQILTPIPPELGNLSKLRILKLSHNIPGEIPQELWNLTSLEELYLEGKNFTEFPAGIINLTNLQSLEVYGNISGSIPAELGLLTNLTNLRLDGNNFTGNIPAELGNLINLRYLFLDFNNLSGAIPPEIGNLTNLKVLFLNDNQLTGSVPAELGNLVNLHEMSFTNNNLSGCFKSVLNNLCGLWSFGNNGGNNFTVTWKDFCNTGAGSCEAVAVWPGDMDNNGIVNSNDLLFYGLAFGNTGTARPNATTLWQPQPAVYWDGIVAGVNGVYQDANGDGIVDFADFTAIEQNFGKTHQIKNMRNNESPVSLKLELEHSSKYGEDIELIYNLYANFGDGIAPNIYGLSGSINFSDLPVKQVTTDFAQSSLQPDKHISFFDNSTGVLDISLTRTDKANVKVADPVARLIIIVDDVPTGDPYKVTIDRGNFTTVTGGLNGIKSSSFYHNYKTNQGVNSSLSFSLNVTNASCDLMGSTVATVTNGVPPYNILWSNGITGARNTNVAAGAYSVYVSDAIGNTAQVEFTIYNSPPVYDQNGNLICGTTCPDYLLPTLKSNNSVFQSGKVIESNSSFMGDRTIHFKAAEAITLDKGFYITPGVNFSADIESCE